jgi:hypothetical protein
MLLLHSIPRLLNIYHYQDYHSQNQAINSAKVSKGLGSKMICAGAFFSSLGIFEKFYFAMTCIWQMEMEQYGLYFISPYLLIKRLGNNFNALSPDASWKKSGKYLKDARK